MRPATSTTVRLPASTIATGLTLTRLTASTIATGLALVVAAGCGSSDPPKARAPLTSISRSRAHSVAPLLTIRAADLPEFKVTAHPAGAQEGLEDRRYVDCVRASAHMNAPHSYSVVAPKRAPLHPWATARSRLLSANAGYHVLGASSEVSIMPTSAAARLAVTKAKDMNRTCMAHAIRAGLAKEHRRLSLRGVVVEPLSTTVKGADTSATYQTVLAYKGAPLVAYVDLIVFSYGQDAVTLATYHASKPVPPAMEERLLGQLMARAKTHWR